MNARKLKHIADNLGLEGVRCVANNKITKGTKMKISQFKDYNELPLFLNADVVAKVLGIAPETS